MFRRFIVTNILLLVAVFSIGQSHMGNLQGSYRKTGNFFSFTTTNALVRIEFCTADMFRLRTSWKKEFEPNESWMVVKYDWAPVAVAASDTKDHILLKSEKLSLKVYKAPFRIDVLKDGVLLSSETLPVAGGGNFSNGDTVGCVKSLAADEHFFGFGERMDFMDRRSKKLKLDVGRGKGLPHAVGAYNILEANYSPIPFFMSTKGYGIFLHNAYPTEWDMGASNNKEYRFSASGGELDYYFIYGPKFPAILQNYTALTGRSPLLPKFGYGLHVGTYSGGTWGYESATSDAYVIALARKLREMGVPADLIWLDSTWRIFGEVGGKGATSFEWRETFNNPKAMFDSLYAMNYNMVGLHLRPRFDNGKKIKLLDTAQALKYTYPEGDKPGEFVNYFDSSSVNWWWQHGVMRVASLGAKFLKTDEGSAFGALANESSKVGPQGREIPKLHNLFPIAYAKAPYEKFQQFNGIRGLNQTREGYAGIQRYPYIFAGDWPSEWQYFAPVIKAGLNIGLSGVGHWAHCMGGFEHPADPELYIRWVQFGMFSPISLVFGMDHPGYKEPWNYGADALRNFKKYDSLRYQLLPYIYSHAYEMYQTGKPLMRALVLDFQDDENVYEIGDQYLFGNSLLVCPVTTKGAQTRTVYLPEGAWFDYWTGKRYEGRQYVHVVTPLDNMPLFVKEGGILATQPTQLYIGSQPASEICFSVYPGAGSFNWYEDDGKSLSYQQQNYSTRTIHSETTKSEALIKINGPVGRFALVVEQVKLELQQAGQPETIWINNKSLSANAWKYDTIRKVLSINLGSLPASAVVVRVKYKS